jgi:hypothetical protein
MKKRDKQEGELHKHKATWNSKSLGIQAALCSACHAEMKCTTKMWKSLETLFARQVAIFVVLVKTKMYVGK